MKILVVSDSHMFNDNLQRIIKQYKNNVDLMIHCGDSSLPCDDEMIKQFDIVVQGNHDDAPFPIYKKYQNICITHGHKYHVYYGYNDLIQLCHQNDCQICLHGHTHVPTIQKIENIFFINPGSLMMNRGNYGYGTYALINIEKNKVDVQFLHHATDEVCPYSIIEEGLVLLEEFKKILP